MTTPNTLEGHPAVRPAAVPASPPAGRVLAVATVVALVGLFASVLALLTQGWDGAANVRYVDAVQRALDLDARLEADVARARLGTVTHFDDLVRTQDQSRANLGPLRTPPAALTARAALDVSAQVARYDELLREKFFHTEQFKSELAVLRNALRLLPRAADDLRDESRVHAGPTGLTEEDRADLSHLLDAVLLLVVDPSFARTETAACALARFGVLVPAAASCPPPPGPPARVGPIGEALLRQSRLVVHGQLALDGRVRALLSLPVAEALHALQATLQSGLYAAEARRRGHELLVALAACATILFGAATIIRRLQAQAAALANTTRRLGVALAELEVERDRVYQLAEHRSRFLAMTSHEFRTPLSLILSSAELLGTYSEGWTPDRRRRHLERIRDAARHMTGMLDRVLLLGKAEAGMLEVRPRRLRVRELLEPLIEELRASVGPDRRLELVLDPPDPEVQVDDELLRHVLLNLLSNAFKYSAADSLVRLSVCASPEALRLDVEDQGIGIPAEDLPKILDPFHRASNARDFKGTGLGLAIVKRALDAQGGELQIQSEAGAGTRVRARIPQKREAI